MKDSAQVIILLRLTTDKHKASCGLSATAELLVVMVSNTVVQQAKSIMLKAPFICYYLL